MRPAPGMSVEALADVIALSLEAKKWFIEIDEFDKAERLLLNFGHTFGHALEAASDFGVSHGIAVGLGMLAALPSGRGDGARLCANAGGWAFPRACSRSGRIGRWAWRRFSRGSIRRR